MPKASLYILMFFKCETEAVKWPIRKTITGKLTQDDAATITKKNQMNEKKACIIFNGA